MSRIYIELIRPSQYDDDGFVIQWQQAFTPANSLACLNGLFQDLEARKVLGKNVSIITTAYDESHTDIPIADIVARFQQADSTGLVAMVGVQTTQYPRALDLAKPFREHNLAVAIGGFHVSGCIAMLPGMDPSLQQALDMGISLFIGEAEDRLTEVLIDLQNGQLKSIYPSEPSLPNLEAQPFPYLPSATVNTYADSVGTCDAGRGCPFKCSFCSIINVQGRKSRSRSAEDIEKMARFNAAQGITRLFITDDNFSRNHNWEEILDRLIALRHTENIKLNLTLQVDTLCHRIPGFVEKAAQAGCSSVFIGLESINPNNLREVDKKQNRITEYQALMQAWRDVKVLTYAGYIIGFPSDTPESVAHDIRTIQAELPIDILEFFILTPLPGSAYHRDLVQKGVVLETDLNQYDLDHVTVAHPTMSAQELARLYRDVWDMYYSPAHIKTLMQRAVASDINPLRLRHAIFRFYGAIAIEGVHPLQAGHHRYKRYAQRRPGGHYPHPVTFQLSYWFDRLIKKYKSKRLFNRIDRIMQQVIAESKTSRERNAIVSSTRLNNEIT